MTATKALFGLRPSRRVGSASNSTGTSEYSVSNGLAVNIFRGDLVALNAGYISPVSVSTQYAQGVFMGCLFTDPITQRPTWSDYWPANTSTTDGFQPICWVVDDPNATFEIQADASVTIGQRGNNYAVTFGAGNALMGTSGFGLLAADGTASGSKMLRLVDLVKRPDNAWTSAFPIVEVKIAQQAFARVSAGSA